MAFVESQEEEAGENSVESLMVKFCQLYFGPMRCKASLVSKDDDNAPRVRSDEERAKIRVAAIDMARRASEEIRRQWKPTGDAH